MKRLEHVRILMYSHDTFGLGHLRRCRTIAHALVERFKGVHVLIISGSPIAGAFDFRARVDFVKIPSVIKLHNGEYTSIDRHIDIHDTLEMRMAMIRHTAKSFEPDIFIVDKEPMGLRGELKETLSLLKKNGCTLIAGLRDVMDSPEKLKSEWEEVDMIPKIMEYYDRIWVYGPEKFWNPLKGLDVLEALERRMHFTGFLERTAPSPTFSAENWQDDDFLLVTTGGGGDGADTLNQVIAAYEHDPDIPLDAVITLGPFLKADLCNEITTRARATGRIKVIQFDNRLEDLIVASKAVVGMCGYNTFCEIMSFDKRALMVPRVTPRKEQYVRAVRAAELGLCDTLHPDEASDPARLAAALRSVVTRPLPSEAGSEQMMNGLDVIADLTEELINERNQHPALSIVHT